MARAGVDVSEPISYEMEDVDDPPSARPADPSSDGELASAAQADDGSIGHDGSEKVRHRVTMRGWDPASVLRSSTVRHPSVAASSFFVPPLVLEHRPLSISSPSNSTLIIHETRKRPITSGQASPTGRSAVSPNNCLPPLFAYVLIKFRLSRDN